MKNIIAFIFLWGMHVLCHAHDPQIAMFYLKNQDGVWTIQGTFAQVGLHDVLVKFYAKEDVTQWGEEEYERKAISYVKSHVQIETCDGYLITLDIKNVKIGDHQSDIELILENSPVSVENLIVEILCMSDNANHRNIFWLPGMRPGEHFVMNKANNFQAELYFTENGETRFVQEKKMRNLSIISPVVLALIVIFVLLMYRNAIKTNRIVIRFWKKIRLVKL